MYVALMATRNRSRKKPKGSLTTAARQQANSRAGHHRRVAPAPMGAAPDGRVFAPAAALSPGDLPRQVRRCRAARHAICEELFSAFRCESFPWLDSPKRRPQGLADVFQTAAAVSAAPVEHFKRSWQHAAERAEAEGFRLEAAPAATHNSKDPCAYIICDHDDCRVHAYNAVSVIVRGSIALEGLDLSGLVPRMGEAEHCAHRRRMILGSRLPELCAEDRFVVPAGVSVPSGLTLYTVEDGTGVAIACQHSRCAAAGKQEIGVSWDSRMPLLSHA